MKNNLTLFAGLALAGLTALAAEEKKDPGTWVIRDSIPEPADLTDTKPATLQFMQNDGADDSYLVDLAVNYLNKIQGVGPAASDFIFTAEWHRNTVAKAPSHSLMADASLEGVLGDVSQGLAAYYTLTATYKDDRIKDDQSLGGGVETCFLTPKDSLLRFLSSGIKFHFERNGEEVATLTPLLQVGASYEDVTRSSTPGDSGHVFRGSLRYSLKLAFEDAAGPHLRNLVLSAEARGWYDFERSGAYSGGTHTRRLYLVSVIYYFDHDKVWGLALKRRDGEDPVAGKPDQHFTSLAFTCNFGQRPAN